MTSEELLDLPIVLIFTINLVATVLIFEAGRIWGRTMERRGGDDAATLEGAMLGLLALMIGFTFSMALTRYEARRDAVVQEANAIGTAVSTARLLPEPFATNTVDLLREYVRIRLEVDGHQTKDEAASTTARSGEIQQALWHEVQKLENVDNNFVPTGIFVEALSQTFDQHDLRLAANRNRVPPIAIWGLYFLGLATSGFTGYSVGCAAKRPRLPAYIVGVLVVSVLVMIHDLDRPDSGFITVDLQSMHDVADGVGIAER
jgi:hypothetical protein